MAGTFTGPLGEIEPGTYHDFADGITVTNPDGCPYYRRSLILSEDEYIAWKAVPEHDCAVDSDDCLLSLTTTDNYAYTAVGTGEGEENKIQFNFESCPDYTVSTNNCPMARVVFLPSLPRAYINQYKGFEFIVSDDDNNQVLAM